MKRCTKCGEHRPATDFSVDRQKLDGKRPSCKPCDAENRPNRLAASRRWKERNADRVAEYKRRLREAAPKQPRAKADPAAKTRAKAAWKLRNPGRVLQDKAARRARAAQATPAWADSGVTADIYLLAKIYERFLGEHIHVDHVVPLRSKVVCGLHVPANLQPIPRVENMRKSNRHWPDMPEAA